jgi:hypothetical protein
MWGGIAANGRLPATLRPPIRANPSTRGFAGGRNVVERSERYASIAKPEGPKDFKARARAGMLYAGFPGSSLSIARAKDGEGDYLDNILFIDAIVFCLFKILI